MDLQGDKMLSVESGDDNILYRIQRHNRRVVYVTVLRPEIIPTEKRTYGPSAIDELSKLEVWNDNDWTTLQVDKDSSKLGDGGIRCIKDFREAHSVPKEYLLDHCPTYDVSNLPAIRHTKSRTWEVSLNGQASFLKIARFPHELNWITQEIQAYHAVAGSSITPRLLGYVSESLTPERIIGILIEKVDGPCAELDDLDRCQDALDELHRYLVHGDLCKYNIIITSGGPKFIDLEDSVLVSADCGGAKLEQLKHEERQSLVTKLADTSGVGSPW